MHSDTSDSTIGHVSQTGARSSCLEDPERGVSLLGCGTVCTIGQISSKCHGSLLPFPLKYSRHYENGSQLEIRVIIFPQRIHLFHIQRLPPSLHNFILQPLHVFRTDVANIDFDESRILALTLLTTSLVGCQYEWKAKLNNTRNLIYSRKVGTAVVHIKTLLHKTNVNAVDIPT